MTQHMHASALDGVFLDFSAQRVLAAKAAHDGAKADHEAVEGLVEWLRIGGDAPDLDELIPAAAAVLGTPGGALALLAVVDRPLAVFEVYALLLQYGCPDHLGVRKVAAALGELEEAGHVRRVGLGHGEGATYRVLRERSKTRAEIVEQIAQDCKVGTVMAAGILDALIASGDVVEVTPKHAFPRYTFRCSSHSNGLVG